MNRIIEIANRLAAAARDDLEGAVFERPAPSLLLAGMSFVRILRIASFWKEPQNSQAEQIEPLLDATTDYVGAMSELGTPWVTLVHGSPQGIALWTGVKQTVPDMSLLRGLLAGAFPDSLVDNTARPDLKALDAMKSGVIFTGEPSSRENMEALSSTQVERVWRGLSGANWAWLTYLRPISADSIENAIESLTREIHDAHVSFLAQQSPVDEYDRNARRYVDLLEHKLERLEIGRSKGLWECRSYLLGDDTTTTSRGRALLSGAYAAEHVSAVPIRICTCQNGVSPDPGLEPLTSGEVAVLTRPPTESYPGYEVVEHVRFGVNSFASLGSGPTLTIGEIIDRGVGTQNTLDLSEADFTKHVLVCGMTGSGKTNTCMQILDQVYRNGTGPPFLVIEPAKSEYRSLLGDARFPGVQVFTVGDETVSPLRLNPLEVPPGVPVQTHADYVKALFFASFVLYPPMPYVLERSIEEIYRDRGWDLCRNTNARGETSTRRFPTLSDLAAKVDTIIVRMGYDDRITMDVRAGLLARINQLRHGGGKGLMLDTPKSLDSSSLFDRSCVMELKNIVSDAEKAFLMGLLLVRLYEHCQSRYVRDTGVLHHVTLIEEAHRLLRNNNLGLGNDVHANPQGHAIEVFANILSEIRAFGEGIMVAEQIPVKLVPDVLKNSNLKIMHRLASEEDRRSVGSTSTLTEQQLCFLPTLEPGIAVVYAEGLRAPILVSIPHAKPEMAACTDDNTVRRAMTKFWSANGKIRFRYKACADCPNHRSVSTCMGGYQGDAPDLLQRDAHRLLNAIRLAAPAVVQIFDDVRRQYQHGSPQSSLGSVRCFLIGFVDHQMEARGAFLKWNHADVDIAIEKLNRIIAVLDTRFAKSTQAQLQASLSGHLNDFKKNQARLHATSAPPYRGCKHCDNQCAYFYDMRAVKQYGSRSFRAMFFDKSKTTGDLAIVAMREALARFSPSEPSVLRGAALCYALQQFAELDLLPGNQESMAQLLAESLKTVTA